MNDKLLSSRQVLQRAFPGLQSKDADEIIATGKICVYPPLTTLCHEGESEQTFYIILSGEVRVTKRINDSEARFLKNLRPGDFFGEMALIQNTPRTASVSTTTPTTVLEIYQDAFSSLLENSNVVSLAMAREVSRRLSENNEMAVDDLRAKAQELATAYQQLAEVEFARREFLTTIAHELRTPLMAANGFLQIIRTARLQGDSLISALDTVGRNVQEIITLTNDILFLQEMDLIMLASQPTDIAALIHRIAAQLHERARQNGVELRLALDAGLPQIQADEKSLERALVAIIDNAIKFSPNGGPVHISAKTTAGGIQIEIQDSGVGIPPEALPRIFDRFFHIDRIGDHLFRGLGLGCSIARQVIEQHHGQINVQSQPGAGTLFTITLPAGSPTEKS